MWVVETRHPRPRLSTNNKTDNTMDNPKVKRIQFDFFYKNKWYRDLTMDYTEADDVTKDYIYDEDGPWYMLEVGDEVIDFQVFSFDGKELLVDACMMYEEDGVYHHGDFLKRLDTAQSDREYDFENIRVEYYEHPTVTYYITQ